MNGGGFYHFVRCVLLLGLACMGTVRAADGAPPAGAPTRQAPPPRTIDDITRLLEHYRPDPLHAARLLAEADAQPPAGGDRDALFRFHWRRGLSARQAGRSDQQIADLRRAAEYGERGSGDYVHLLRNLAAAETQGGNLIAALHAAEQSLQQTPRNQRGQALAALQLLTRQWVLLGDFAAARQHLARAENLYARLQRAPRWEQQGLVWTALMERARGEVFAAVGELGPAEDAYRKSLGNIERYIASAGAMDGAGAEEARLMLEGNLHFREGRERSLAATLLAQGKLVEAEIYARQALRHALERVGRASADTAQALGLLARIVAEYGRNAEAARLAEEAVRSYEMAGVVPEALPLAMARRALGSALTAQGKYAQALQVFEARREALRKDPKLLAQIGAGDLDWVLAHLRTGAQPEAERLAKAMLAAVTQKFGDDSVRTAEVRAFYAMTLAVRGARADALALFRAAVPLLLDRAHGAAEAETATIRRRQRLVTILESYLKLLSEAGQEAVHDVGDAADEAFRIADIARGSAVQQALTASAARADIADPRLADLARREQDGGRRIGALSALLAELLGAPPEQQLPKIQAQMRADIAQLQQERDTLRREIAAAFPDYAELVAPRPATLAQAARSLRPDEALLAFYFGEEASFVWALRADGQTAFARIALTRGEMAQAVKTLRGALDPGVADIDALPPFDVAVAYRLYAELLLPVEPVWRAARVLVVVPHAELGQLPLALLPTAAVPQPGASAVPFAGYRAVPWLLAKAAIAQLPSVTALASLRRLPPGDPARRAFIGFGDPLFSQAQAAAAGVPAPAAPLATRSAFRLRSSPRTAAMDSAGLALLPRLPDTNEEIRAVGRVLGADPAQDIYLQARASERTVLEADLAHRRVVMFATHGLVPGDLDGLTQPALALTSPEVAAGAGDGFLTMDKVLALRLNADWVVLSACNTAAGAGAGAEAVSGLGRAFFYAGARALLVSNWPVETVAARLLMTDLFRRQAAGATVKAEALRQAMLALIAGPGAVDAKTGKADYSYAHPLFWAPFVVVGD